MWLRVTGDVDRGGDYSGKAAMIRRYFGGGESAAC